jgi:flagellar protein FliS
MTQANAEFDRAEQDAPSQTALQAEAFDRYMASSISTAPPNTMLTMLYDALCDDLRTSEKAFDTNDIKGVNDSLVHAQQIIIALRDSLRLDLWDGAKGLASLYDFLLNELIAANVHKDRERARACSAMIAQLAEAWRQAARAGDGAGQGAIPEHRARAAQLSSDNEPPCANSADQRRSVINEMA